MKINVFFYCAGMASELLGATTSTAIQVFAIRFTSSLLIACYPHIKQRIIVFRYWSLLTSYSCVILQNSNAANKFDTRFNRITPDSESSLHPSRMDHAGKQK